MNNFYLKQLFRNPSLLRYGIQSTFPYRNLSKLTLSSKISKSRDFEKETLLEYNNSRKYGFKESICLAADSNMFFDMYGKVYLCCYNRKYLIGDTTKEKLVDIWRGKKRLEAQNNFSKNNLVEGCSMCYLNIQKGEHASAMSQNFDIFSKNKQNYPSRMDFELSNTCNLECVMCNGDFSNLIRKNRENRPPIALRYKEDFLEQLDEFIPHLQFANFLGGEPQLIPIYYKIWEKLVNAKKAIIRVQTNASVLDERFLKMIQHSNQFQISVSMDALNPDIIKEIRKNINPDIFLKNLDTLIALYKRNKIDLSLSVCPMTVNKDDLLNIVTFAEQNRIKVYFNQLYSPYHLSLMSLDSFVLSNFKNQLTNYIEKEDFINNNLLQLKNLINLIDNWILRSSQNESLELELQNGLLADVKQKYFQLLESYKHALNLEEKNIIETKNFIDDALRNLSEENQKFIYAKLINLPTEFDNMDFHDTKISGYFYIIKEYISILKDKIN